MNHIPKARLRIIGVGGLSFLVFIRFRHQHPSAPSVGGGLSSDPDRNDVLLSVPDDSIVPFTLESMVSAICVSGTYIGNNKFKLTICVTIVLKVLASVEILIPSYGFCPIPPCEEFAENVCDEFFSLPLFPPMSICNEGGVALGNAALNNGGCSNGGRGCGC